MTSYFRQSRQNDVLGNINRVFTGLGDRLEKDVREHLKNVYSTLTLCMFTAVVGVIACNLLHLASWHLILSLGTMGLIFALMSTPASRENEKKRLTYLFALSFLIGVTTGPLISHVGASDPSIVFTAYLITLVVFGSFSLAALFAESTKFLHLGGFLSSALLALFITSFFARYAAVQPLLLYGGLIVNSLFIVYDTQLIAEKRRRGDTDYIVHCMELFIDFVQVFRYLLILLKDRSDSDRRRRRD